MEYLNKKISSLKVVRAYMQVLHMREIDKDKKDGLASALFLMNCTLKELDDFVAEMEADAPTEDEIAHNESMELGVEGA